MAASPEPAQKPSLPQLEPAERAFARGSFEQLERLLHAPSKDTEAPSAGAPEQARRAQLEHAVEVDPAHLWVLVLCVLGLIAVTASYL